MNFPKEKFIFSVKFKDKAYNKETYTDLSENFMEEYERDTFAKMALDKMIFNGFNLICHILDLDNPRLKFFLDLKQSFKFICIEELEQTGENESLFCGKFEFEAIPFNEQTYGLMYGKNLPWDDVLHKQKTRYAREDMRSFLQYAAMEELKNKLEYDRDEDYCSQMLHSLEVFNKSK
jgi:hypothetical protein